MFCEWMVGRVAREAGVDIKGIDRKQLAAGYRVEREHDGRMGKDTAVGKEPADFLKIAVAHLRERPDYYRVLKKSGL